MDRHAGIVGDVDRRQRGTPVDGGEPAGIAIATVDWGTALAPIYVAHDAGVAVHVFVDETRPRRLRGRVSSTKTWTATPASWAT
jgi:hypothetical protein